jgi:hypothetical protein
MASSHPEIEQVEQNLSLNIYTNEIEERLK